MLHPPTDTQTLKKPIFVDVIEIEEHSQMKSVASDKKLTKEDLDKEMDLYQKQKSKNSAEKTSDFDKIESLDKDIESFQRKKKNQRQRPRITFP